MWSFRPFEMLVQDFRYALRQFRHAPGFAARAVLTLALGIGAATTMFSVIDGAVLNPFPYQDISHLAALMTRDPVEGPGFQWAPVPVREFLEYRRQSHTFDSVIGGMHDNALLTGGEVPLTFSVLRATGNVFQVLGVQPLMGRTFTSSDAAPGAPPVVVLNYNAWRSKLGGDPDIVGKMLMLDHRQVTVIGVMPRRFDWMSVDMLVPQDFAALPPTARPYFMWLAGRLKTGVSVRQAAAEAATLSGTFTKLFPKDHPERKTFSVVPLTDALLGPQPIDTLYILFGAVGLLFGIGCVNVANLLLARATSRETEIAIRVSLGAGRLRLLGQLLAESLILAAGGAVLGCLFATAGLRALLAVIPPWDIPVEADIHINGMVLLFTVGVALVATMLFGLAPALQAVRRDPRGDLRSVGWSSGVHRGQSRVRNLLVVGEVALSLVLLSGAGMLVHSFFDIHHVELGYDPAQVLHAGFSLPESQYTTADARNRFSMEALRRMRALPGVASAAFAAPPPVWGGWPTQVEIPGRPGNAAWRAQVGTVSDGFFATMRIPLLEGRTIVADDYAHARKVTVVNRRFAARYFSGQNPLGQDITLKGLSDPPFWVKEPTFEIVGVAGDIRDNGPNQPPTPSVYVPYTATGLNWDSLLVRAAGSPGALLKPLRRELATMDNELPMEGEPLSATLNRGWFADPQFELTLMSAFASLGLALVLFGVYSVLSYSVTRRTREFAVRMAFGAEGKDVRRLVIGSGVRWLLAGIALGVPASIWLAKVLANRIWGLKTTDPLTLTVVAASLMLTGVAACYFPARRATRVEPMQALRHQ